MANKKTLIDKISETRNLFMLLGLLVVIIFAVQVLNDQENHQKASTSVASNDVVTNDVTAEDVVKTKTNTTTTKGVAFTKMPLTLTYGAAIATYSYRFQFANCQILPQAQNVKVGSIVMLDNRDNANRTLGFGSFKYSFGPYGYQIFKTGVPGEYPVTCDGVNRGKLTVYK